MARTVLVVDDDHELQWVLGQYLMGEGFYVAVSSNGEQALRFLKEHHLPSLIVLDLEMPVMNGLKFREEQLRDKRLRDLPVIIFSANPDAASQARALRCPHFVPKSSGFAFLIRKIHKVLS